jgi:hypothetical protein
MRTAKENLGWHNWSSSRERYGVPTEYKSEALELHHPLPSTGVLVVCIQRMCSLNICPFRLSSLNVATHVTASLTSSHDQSFCTSTHKIPSPQHGTSTLEQAPVYIWNMSSSDDDALALDAFRPYVQEKTAKE